MLLELNYQDALHTGKMKTNKQTDRQTDKQTEIIKAQKTINNRSKL